MNKQIIFFSLITSLFTGCFYNGPDIKKLNAKTQIDLNQEKKYINNQVENMVKMVYENNFIQQKISDIIDDLGTSTINDYDNTYFKTVKIPFDDIDRITNYYIKIFKISNIILAYKLGLIDYNNNITELNIKKKVPVLYYYVINKKTGIGKIIDPNKISKLINMDTIVIYKINNFNKNNDLYIEKYDKKRKKFVIKLRIDLSKIKNYINNIDNIVITIKKNKG